MTLTEGLSLVVGFEHRNGYQGGFLSVSVTDSDSSNYNGGTLTVSMAAQSDSANEYITHSVNHRFSRQAGADVIGGQFGVIGTLVNDVSVPGEDLVIALNENATPEAIASLFSIDVVWGMVNPSASSTGTRTFTITLTEANGELGSGTITIPAITAPQTSKVVSTFSDNVVLSATANSRATAESLFSFEIDTTHESFSYVGATIAEMTFTLSGNFDASNLDFELDGPLLFFRDPNQRFILSGNRLSINETGYRLISERTAFTLKAWYKDASKIADNATLQVSLVASDVASDNRMPFNGFAPAPAITSGTISSVVEASELRFTQIPDSTTTGLILSPTVTVNATDSLGNVDVDYASDVTLSIAPPNSGTLRGITTVTPTNGIAVFSRAWLNSSVTSGSENTAILASASGLTSATSSPVQVFAQNRPPVIFGNPVTEVNEGAFYTFQPTASDPDSPSIGFSVANLPSWAAFDSANGQISGTPGFRDAGVYENIVITVYDTTLSASLPPFSIVVSNVNAAPQLTLEQDAALVVGFEHGDGYQSGMFDVTVIDSDSTDFDGGTLRISMAAQADSANEFLTHGLNHLRESTRLAGSDVLSPGYGFIGTLVNDASVPGSDLVIALNERATPDAIEELFWIDIAWGMLDPAASSPGSRTITVILTEATGVQGSASITLPAIIQPQTTTVVSTFADNVVIPSTANSYDNAEVLFNFEIVSTHELVNSANAYVTGMTFVLGGNLDTTNLDFRLDGPLIYQRDPDQTFVLAGNRLSINESAYRLNTDRSAYTLRAWYKDTSKIVDNATLQVSLDPYNDITLDDRGLPLNKIAPAPAIISGTISSVVEASELRFTQIPDSSTTGLSLTPAVSVNATDSLGNVDADYTSNVTLSVAASNPGSISGDTTIASSNGIAVFSNVSLNSTVTSGSENTAIQASASGLNFAISSPVQVFAENRPPIISGNPTTKVNEGLLYTFQPFASDPDSTSLSFSVVNLPSWASFDSTTGLISGTPGYRDAGEYENITIMVTDGELSASLSTFNIVVSDVNTAPFVSNVTGQVAEVFEDASVQVQLNASDAERDELTWSVLTQPAHGSARILSSGTQFDQVLYTPNSDVSGTDSVVLSVSDGHLSSSFTLSFTVQPVNDAPSISGTPATTVNENEPYSFAPVASDIEGDSLTFSAVNLPVWLVLDPATGALTGTPDFSAAGSYSGIQLRVSDGVLFTSLSPFTIQVLATNRAPVIDLGDTFALSLTENSGISVSLKASDPDGDNISWSRVTQIFQAQVDLSDNGELSYKPDAGFSGKETIVFAVSDGSLSDSIAIAFDVRAVNDAPEISGTPKTEINEQSRYQFLPVVSDQDGDVLTFSAQNLPAWLTLNSGTGELSGAADSNDVGVSDNIIITVSDGKLDASLPPFSIRVIEGNAPPVLEDLSFTMSEDGVLSHQMPVTDANGDSLTYSIEQMAANGSSRFVAQVLIYNPDADFFGDDSFKIRASDGVGVSEVVTVTVTVNSSNDAPVIQPLSLNLKEDESAVGDILATDVDNDNLTLSIAQQGQLGTAILVGHQIEYQPLTDANGTDHITVMASDGELDTRLVLQVNIESINDTPVAKGESISMDRSNSGQYLINVLGNDSDKDIATNNDKLRITNLDPSFGSATVSNDQVLLNVGTDFRGEVTIDYVISDAEGASDSATVLLNIVTGLTYSGVTLRAPPDIVVDATGLLTEVALGEATALSPEGESLPVNLMRDDSLFTPGRHLVTWRVETNTDETILAAQRVDVNPLISLGAEYTVVEGDESQIDVILNGESPTYPLLVTYSIAGTADANDHNLQAGQISIEQGIRGTIAFETFADSLEDDGETLIIELIGGLNASQDNLALVSIAETQSAPSFYLNILQKDKTITTIAQTNGAFQITPVFANAEVVDELGFSWRLNGNLLSGNDGTELSLNARQLPLGLNTVSLTLTRAQDAQLSTIVDINFMVVSRHQILTQNDQDGDLIPDSVEGFVDSNLDGIADYLDAIDSCSQVPVHVQEQRKFVAQASSGTCLRLGGSALVDGANGIGVSETDVANDDDYQLSGEAIAVDIYQLNSAGASAAVVIPLIMPIAPDARYRTNTSAAGWQDFIIDSVNQIYSAPGAMGVCPDVGAEEWQPGVITDSWCLKLELSDGGANDADGVRNNAIKNFGGLATPAQLNRQPVATNDSAFAKAGVQMSLNVLDNDYDPDGDAIRLRWMSAGLGAIEYMDNGSVMYTPFVGLQGKDEILYEIEDSKGEKAAAMVTVVISAD